MSKDASSHDQDLLKILRGLESKKEEYPAELLSARRKLFIEQVENQAPPEHIIESGEQDQKLIQLIRSLKAFEPGYPIEIFLRRRAAYQRRLVEARMSIWQVLRSSLQNIFAGWSFTYRSIPSRLIRTSALALGIAMFAFVAFALYGTADQVPTSIISQNPVSTPMPVTVTPVAQAAIICENGYEPPLCLPKGFNNGPDLSYAGNGTARPAVAKDTFSGDGHIHQAAHLNDGFYGPGASWVSNSPHSWIKIDMGTTTDVNTVTFGRDRLGNLNDGDPGRFVIAVATSDDIYANGNSSNDDAEYMVVYDSRKVGFDGNISGAETVVAWFETSQARFIKITFENAHTAIDEVEAFASDPSVIALAPTRTSSKENSHPEPSTPLLIIINTPLPTDTATAVPIDTLSPTETVTPIPTDPPTPVETPTPVDTPPVIEPTISPPSYTPIVDPTDEPTPTEEPIEPVSDDELNWIRDDQS